MAYSFTIILSYATYNFSAFLFKVFDLPHEEEVEHKVMLSTVTFLNFQLLKL